MDRTRFSLVKFMVGLVVAAICFGCSGGAAGSIDGGDTLSRESSLLTLVDMGDYVLADISDPWSTDSALLERYVFVDKDYTGSLPEGATVVRVPLERSIVYSGVHGGAIAELGAVDAIAGVADGMYFTLTELKRRIADGRIADVGNSMQPSVEKMVDLDPGAILLSPYQSQELGVVAKLGIPVVQCVDYMEQTPLGRAEWIKLLGVMYGRRAEADSIYASVVEAYNGLKARVTDAMQRPTVITETPQSGGIWNMPAGESYMAAMLRDAGADYVWADTEGSGSLTLDVAAVLDRASEADYWLIRSYGPLTLSELTKQNPLNARFKAVGAGGVYVCDTSTSALFDEFPFHPERLLLDYLKIFHPQTFGGPTTYFGKISE